MCIFLITICKMCSNICPNMSRIVPENDAVFSKYRCHFRKYNMFAAADVPYVFLYYIKMMPYYCLPVKLYYSLIKYIFVQLKLVVIFGRRCISAGCFNDKTPCRISGGVQQDRVFQKNTL